jgi:hypothetical protein
VWLRRQPCGQRVSFGIEVCHDAASFQWNGCLPAEAELPAYAVRRLRKAMHSVAMTMFELGSNVAVPLRVQKHCIICQSIADARNCRQRLILNLDKLREILRAVPVSRDYESERLANKSHAIDRQEFGEAVPDTWMPIPHDPAPIVER